MSSDQPAEHPEPVAVGSYPTEGEAEVARAKLGAYGIDSAIADPIEGGTVPMEGEDGVILQVRSEDAEQAASVLAERTTADDSPSF